MPSLNWLGKDAVLNHHQDVPYKTLELKNSFNCELGASENKIIHGDNLEALKALMPEYEGRIKCIYIDPPYNTGNTPEKGGWIYNDNVDSPKIRKWLGQVVGKEFEDLTRHDKWLCMMYPRLKLLKKLLSENGCLVISIGFQELHNLIALCKAMFEKKQIVTVTVQTTGGNKASNGFMYSNDYLIFVVPEDFTPNISVDAMNTYSTPYHGMNLATFSKRERPNQVYPIYVNKQTGILEGVGKTLQELIDSGAFCGNKESFVYDYSIAPKGCVAIYPVTEKGADCVWRLIPERLVEDWKKGYIKISPTKKKNSRNQFTVQYLSEGIIQKIESGELEVVKENTATSVPTLNVKNFKAGGSGIHTVWTEKKFYTAKGTDLIAEIFGDKRAFPYSKPLDLIKEILLRVSEKDSIILDSFAGSGTTAHAVLDLNKQDGGHRKFIIVEMENYADSITAERVRRVIGGYGSEKQLETVLYNKKITLSNISKASSFIEEMNIIENKENENFSQTKRIFENNELKLIGITSSSECVPGTGGDFNYYELGSEMMLDGCLNEKQSIQNIRNYIYYTETKIPINENAVKENGNEFFLGNHENTAYYLFYKKSEITTLDAEFLGSISQRAERYVIYADNCVLSKDFLFKHNIIFKKIPRDVRKF